MARFFLKSLQKFTFDLRQTASAAGKMLVAGGHVTRLLWVLSQNDLSLDLIDPQKSFSYQNLQNLFTKTTSVLSTRSAQGVSVQNPKIKVGGFTSPKT